MSLPDSKAISDAKSRQLTFNPHDITSSISENKSEEDIRKQFAEFIELYPELFKKIINKNDLSLIQNMLAMLDSMGDGKLSQHEASVIIGKNLVDKYVTPQLHGS